MYRFTSNFFAFLSQEFQYVDTSGKEQGMFVREMAKRLVRILQNDAHLQSERERAQEARGKVLGTVLAGTYIQMDNENF